MRRLRDWLTCFVPAVPWLITAVLIVAVLMILVSALRPKVHAQFGGVQQPMFTAPVSAGAGPDLIYDDFSVNVAAGAVNGTDAARSGGVGEGSPRIVHGVQNNFIVTNNFLLVIGSAGASWTNNLFYTPTISRVNGRTLYVNFNSTNVGSAGFGFDTDATNHLAEVFVGLADDQNLYATFNFFGEDLGDADYKTNAVNAYYLNTNMQTATVLLSTGYLAFAKGGAYSTNWTLLGENYNLGGTNTNLRVGLGSAWSYVFRPYLVRVPAGLWTPAPVVADTFTGGNSTLAAHSSDGVWKCGLTGGSGKTWTGSGWVITNGYAFVVPQAGAEIVGDTGFDTPAYWTQKGTEWTVSGSKAAHTTGGTISQLGKTNLMNPSWWYQVEWDVDSESGSEGLEIQSLNATWYGGTGHHTVAPHSTKTGAPNNTFAVWAHTVYGCTIDNLSLKRITNEWAIVDAGTADGYVEAVLSVPTNHIGGIVANVDLSKTNYIRYYVDRYESAGKLHLDYVVGGVVTPIYTNTIASPQNAVTLKLQSTLNGIATPFVQWFYNGNWMQYNTNSAVTNFAANTSHGLLAASTNTLFSAFRVFAWAGTNYTGLDGL